MTGQGRNADFGMDPVVSSGARSMSAIAATNLLVLAGGFGTRLSSVLTDLPKPLAPVGGKPFLHLQLRHWIGQGLRSFVFLLHHRADLIIDFLGEERNALLRHCDVRWVIEPSPLGTGGAVAHAVEHLDIRGDFLVTNADTWLGTGVAELMAVESPAMAVVRVEEAGRYGSVRFDSDMHVTEFAEKCKMGGPGWINAGLCRLSAASFGNWNHRAFSLETQSFPMWASERALRAVPLATDFIDIGVPDDYFRMCRWTDSRRTEDL